MSKRPTYFMPELYKIHFNYSKSRRYLRQALELAMLAYKHVTEGSGDDLSHTIIFTDDQIDLMAAIYKLVRYISDYKIYGASIFDIITYLKEGRYNYHYASEVYKHRVVTAANKVKSEQNVSNKEIMRYLEEKYLKAYGQDMTKVINKLQEEGYLDYIDKTGNYKLAIRRPKEHLVKYHNIRQLIHTGKYREAVKEYYTFLGNKHYDDLNSELIYLKRLANIPLEGRDILCFGSKSTQEELIESNMDEYVGYINKVLDQYKKSGSMLPMDIIIDNAPTMEKLIKNRRKDWHKGVYLWDGKFKRDHTPVDANSFSYMGSHCIEGRLFDKYPDQISYCRIIEYPNDNRYAGLWTTYSPSFIKNKIVNKGLHLNGIEDI